jgi:hypothetical protein
MVKCGYGLQFGWRQLWFTSYDQKKASSLIIFQWFYFDGDTQDEAHFQEQTWKENRKRIYSFTHDYIKKLFFTEKNMPRQHLLFHFHVVIVLYSVVLSWSFIIIKHSFQRNVLKIGKGKQWIEKNSYLFYLLRFSCFP